MEDCHGGLHFYVDEWLPCVHPQAGCCRLVLVSGMGAKGTSYVTLGSGALLGLDGARRLAGLLRAAPPPLLTLLDLRRAFNRLSYPLVQYIRCFFKLSPSSNSLLPTPISVANSLQFVLCSYKYAKEKYNVIQSRCIAIMTVLGLLTRLTSLALRCQALGLPIVNSNYLLACRRPKHGSSLKHL